MWVYDRNFSKIWKKVITNYSAIGIRSRKIHRTEVNVEKLELLFYNAFYKANFYVAFIDIEIIRDRTT